ncbi:MAG TPA: hypothetical protein VNO14_10760 [Blastocatellia bacterium]|nr:hypothetical protein [Blastocatellia bacterium]
MDSPEARRIIASYLSGYQTVTREELFEACEAIKSDDVYMKYLREELGLGDDWVILCDVFEERVGEFSDMSPGERSDEMPELVDHLDSCGSCRRLYWRVSPLWKEAPPARDRSFIRELGEHIRLLVDKAGRLRELGLGPPALRFAPVATRLSEPEDPSQLPFAAKRKEWSLHDEAADCHLKLIVEGQQDGATLSCSIQPGQTSKVSAEQTRIEVRDAASGSLLIAGRLSDIAADPINLPFGSWLIHLLSRGREDSFAWRVPLEIEAEG